MPRIQPLAMLACTLALLLPACDPPEDPYTSMGGPSDFSDAPDDPEGDTDPRPEPHRLDRLANAPRGRDVLPADAHGPEDLVDEPGHDTCPEPWDDLDELADAVTR